MTSSIEQILNQENHSKQDLITLLTANEEDTKLIFAKAAQTKKEHVGNLTYLRGLIEYSNWCTKDCYYCGIRLSNTEPNRYTLTDKEVLDAANYAFTNGFGSIVIQSGERSDRKFTSKITELVTEIHRFSEGKLGITLSLGEQSEDIYRQWFNAGAHRYLLRIEESNQEVYQKLHPADHSFSDRIHCLETLKKIGYQVGTGVMIGLPFQTIEHLAADLLFFQNFDIHMVGMGPYIEHQNTPIYEHRNTLIDKQERFNLSLKMVALLRIMMKDINIAATTALQTIDKMGREKALKIGANIIMPNLTPEKYRGDYLLYEDKPCINEDADECKNCMEARICLAGDEIGYWQWGDSKHFTNKL